MSESLKQTDAVLLLLIDKELTKEGIACLRTFNADLHITDMSEEVEAAVSKAADDEVIIQAVEAEFATDWMGLANDVLSRSWICVLIKLSSWMQCSIIVTFAKLSPNQGVRFVGY